MHIFLKTFLLLILFKLTQCNKTQYPFDLIIMNQSIPKYLNNIHYMSNPFCAKKKSPTSIANLFRIILMYSLVFEVIMCNKIIGLTPKTMPKLMDCFVSDPIYCATQEDWLLLFYNSNNTRQQQTFQYLLRGFNKQLIYSKESHKQRIFEYPSTAVIDCFSSASLCKYVQANSLPLAIYKETDSKNPIRYQGYVTLPGLISFIKTHDPTTSYLSAWYKPQGEYIKSKDYTQKQINEILKKVLPKLGQQPIKQTNKNEKKEQNMNNTYEQQPFKYKIELQNEQIARKNKIVEEENKIRQKKQLQKIRQKEQQQAEMKKINEQKIKKDNEKANNQAQEQKNNKKTKKIGDPKQKKKNTEKQADFLAAVNSASSTVTDLFASMGVGGIFLQTISWISYAFFFVFFGILCIVVS